MNKEMIDKCLDFAEGHKGKFTILMAKKKDFPETLKMGTPKQQEINQFVEQGLATRQIAEMMGCTQPNIMEHLRQYKRSVSFYNDWIEFWGFAAPLRQTPICVVFDGILSEDDFSFYSKKGINTVEDFLNLSVHGTATNMSKTLNGLTAEIKTLLFKRLREQCYELLPHGEEK